jgi:uncharacterized phage protein (TIGR02220 family)
MKRKSTFLVFERPRVSSLTRVKARVPLFFAILRATGFGKGGQSPFLMRPNFVDTDDASALFKSVGSLPVLGVQAARSRLRISRFSFQIYFRGIIMAKGNWFKTHRELENHWLWQKKPFSPGQAWIDCIMKANHQDRKIPVDGEFVTIKRGQFLTSIRILSERWGWSRTKTVKFLTCLESDKMLIKKSDTKKTLITIINYSYYQDKEATEKPPKSHRKATEKPPKDTNKKGKKGKEGKEEKIYKEAIKILGWLNLHAGKRFKRTAGNLSFIIARLREGFTSADCLHVIKIKCQQWKNTEMDKFLRPSTLFRPSKFEGYLNEKEIKKQTWTNDPPQYQESDFDEVEVKNHISKQYRWCDQFVQKHKNIINPSLFFNYFKQPTAGKLEDLQPMIERICKELDRPSAALFRERIKLQED